MSGMTLGATVIEARNVKFRYNDGTTALDGIDFRLLGGECVALLGPNGSGKTTFALRLVGLIEGEGEIDVCGQTMSPKTVAAIRSRIGIVFQDSEEQLFMPTVLEDVAFGPRNQGNGPEKALEMAKRALAQVQLSHVENKPPYHLSAGEKRRAALAGVLAMNPEILILDEPTTFLDPPAQRGLIELLKALPQAKILITHDIGFSRALATRAVFFEKGKVAGEGTVGEVVDRFGWEV